VRAAASWSEAAVTWSTQPATVGRSAAAGPARASCTGTSPRRWGPCSAARIAAS
jgi:hypothetical protein